MFLTDFDRFIGTGQLNFKGQTLEEFLKDYNPKAYDNPSNTVDIVVFGYDIVDEKLKVNKVLLIKRANHPCIGLYALPGGFVEYREDLENSAKRELFEETNLDNVRIEQFATYGDYDRDPRTRVITTAYVALAPNEKISVQAGDDAKEAKMFDFSCIKTFENTKEGVRREEFTLEFQADGSILEAVVEKNYYTDAILREEKYSVVKSDLSADHAAIIANAFCYIEDKLERRRLWQR